MKFDSKPILEHNEAPLADDGRFESLVSYWQTREARPGARDNGTNSCYVVSVGVWKTPETRDAQLAEILALVRAQGDTVVGYEAYQLVRPEPRTLFGRGAYEEIARRAAQCGSSLLVLDAELTPSQLRNLEDATGLAVCDREAVILNVFLRHAKTRKAKIQVEIAHLEYLRPRIRGLGLQMDQQAGGVMRGRGPGETASELLARQLDRRLAQLRKTLTKLRQAGETQRKGRTNCKQIVLLGYTNAGKTTLMNALTSAELSARNMPFETLDTTSRCLTRHGGDVLLSDTVGVIRRLPERLLASFESTLSEIEGASLLVLVVDSSDPEWEMHLATTEALLLRLGADKLPRFYVFNKADRAATTPSFEQLQQLSRGHEFTSLSALDPDAIAQLKERLICVVRQEHKTAEVFVPYQAAETMSEVYARCLVLKAEPTPDGLDFTISGEAHVIEQIKKALEEVQR